MIELTPEQEHNKEEAWKALLLAKKLADTHRRARGQEVLREAQACFFKLPRGFTDADFEQQYDRLYNQLYRGYF